MKLTTKIAGDALKAAVEFSAETMKIVDLGERGIVSPQLLQRTAILPTMRKRLQAMEAFIAALEEED